MFVHLVRDVDDSRRMQGQMPVDMVKSRARPKKLDSS